MSISAYVGLPGHGKSYGVVENVIIPSLKNKRAVFTNVPLNHEKCLQDFGMCATPFETSDIVKNPNWWSDVFEAGAILVFDEAWRLWPSGLKASGVRETDKTFLNEHRHFVGDNGFSTEIYYVTQDLSQVALFARVLVETTFRMVKRSNIGLDKNFRVDVYAGPASGPRPPKVQLERQIHGGRFKKEIYAYYKSHTKSQTGGAGNEQRTDKRYNVLMRSSIWLGFLLVGICVFFIFFGFGKVKKMYEPPVKESLNHSSFQSSSLPSGQSSRIPVNAQVAQPTAPQQAGFLSKTQRINISYISGPSNNRMFFYKALFENSEVLLSALDLTRLGYSLTLINDCLVKVTGFDYNGFIMCPKSSRKDSGLIAGLTADLTPNSVEPVK